VLTSSNEQIDDIFPLRIAGTRKIDDIAGLFRESDVSDIVEYHGNIPLIEWAFVIGHSCVTGAGLCG